ncbi:MAG: sigma-E factor negative regulatory protein [Gammaproteobacteria bacterium]|nr:anti-sigma factor [Sideroxydans sp.]MBU3903995.1 sigma-E factor negative regulatory protein [Gammaproteobacteria bacterium]MBU4045788.1 sigma-E factor negative regulatory protein [Gammaproteobacteria bacterium]MBU4150805.1 sigma-E factor negative regulatory protein [Gammaproteobacteria bacterium]
MKQEISVLMDGEMFEDEADVFLDKLKRHPETDRDWAEYHLIGDALRQPDHINRDFMAVFHERLQAEPIILAPRRRQQQRIKQYALSAAASVMALALVAWLSMQVGQEPAPQMASVQQQNMVRPVAFHASDYLMAHQEFSPSADVQGAATYIHSVAAK